MAFEHVEPRESSGTRSQVVNSVPRLSAGTAAGRSPKTIQSVDRALTLLEILARARDAMPLGEVAAAARLNASTCHHLISTLVERGFVLHAGRNRGYLLSSRLRELAEIGQSREDISEFARGDLTRLARRLCQEVHLSVLQDGALITRFKAAAPEAPVVGADEVVQMRAAHAAAAGKAILAWLPESVMVKIISQNGLQKFTGNTITGLSELIEEFRWVRRNGYAVDREELQDGLTGFGAALRDESGAVIASIAASLPTEMAVDPYRDRVVSELANCARQLSDRLKVDRF